MSYQSYLKSTAAYANSKTPSPGSTHRKPPPTSAPSNTPSFSSIHSTLTKNATTTSTNAPFTPASSTNSPANLSAPKILPVSGSSIPTREPTRTPLTKEQIDAALKACLDLQITAATLHEKRPFAALLLGPDNTTSLLTHFSISHVQHAETELARLATLHFTQEYLAACTLVSTWEPCAMCAGTLYWSNIGRLLYAASEEKLKDLTGGNNKENMTMSLPCRDVLKAGQKDTEVIGPVKGWEEKVVEESAKWWKEHQSNESVRRLREGSVNGSERAGSLSSMRHGTPTTWTGEETVLSSIDDEGEYKAELDIDWMR